MNIFEKALCGHFLLPVVLIDKKASNFLQKNGLEGLITTALHRGGETNVRTFSLGVIQQLRGQNFALF